MNLGQLWNERETLLGWLQYILAWYREGKVRAAIGARFAFDRAAEAHR